MSFGTFGTFGLENTVDEDDRSVRHTCYGVVMTKSHDTRTCREYMGVRGHDQGSARRRLGGD